MSILALLMWYLIVLSFHLLCTCTTSIAVVANSLFVSRRTQQSQSTKDSNGETFIEGPFTIFDEYGSMPSFEDTFKLLQASSPVVVILGTNFTLISFREDHPPGGLRSLIKTRTVIRLTDRLAVVVSGVAGDCRRVAQVAKELVANHSFAYGTAPSGYFLASKVAQFLQEATTGSKRPFSCHVFVCSSLLSDGADRFILPAPIQAALPGVRANATTNSALEPAEQGSGYSMNRFLLRRRSVFSISPAGSLSLVQAACSGGGGGGRGGARGLKGAQSMLQLLEAEYRPGLNVEEAGDLAQRCMSLAKLPHSVSDNSVAASSSTIKYLLFSENQS